MATEKGKSSSVRNAEAILNHVQEYLAIRFDHAGRINPPIRTVKEDLLYHELANVRHSLLGEKIYGPIRQVVADVLLGDDRKKREGILSRNDQNSIQVEIVSHCQDERSEATRGQIKIHDLKTFYASINPALSDFMDLVETWIWWDLPDAVELARFELKLGVLQMIRQGRFTPEMRKRYAQHIQTQAGGAEEQGPMSNEDIVRYEVDELKSIRERWAYRRASERGYMYVLKRDEVPPPDQKELIHQIADKIREYDQVEMLSEVNPEMRQRYAREMHLTPDKIERKHVLEHLQAELLEIEREMLRAADHERELGAPYNYKERQLVQMDRMLPTAQQMIDGGRATGPMEGEAKLAAEAGQPA